MRVQNKDANNLADVYQNLVENADVMKQYYDSLDKANNWAKENTVKSNHSKPDFLDLDNDGNTKESMKKATQDKKKKLCTKCKQEVNESLINTNYTLSTFNKTGICKPCQDLHNQMYPNAKLNSEFGWII